MTTIGIDIEQFVVDPYGSGIQRVLQYLAKGWPTNLADGVFVFPRDKELNLLEPAQAAELISLAFAPGRNEDLRIDVTAWLEMHESQVRRATVEEISRSFDCWLLPEVSYLPSVLFRFEFMAARMPTGMIGYDALPMTEPANYRFPPGVAACASEYFRLLASTDALVCISDYSRDAITKRLRRGLGLITTVAHPGGDHVPAAVNPRASVKRPVHFLRLGTMEPRKMPLEILRAFLAVRETGIDARLTFVGGRSSSYEWMNQEVKAAALQDRGFRWISDASDADIPSLMAQSDALVSFGTEGYGIPVLEAIRHRLPVLYGGFQPAAELVQRRGAVHCGPATEETIRAALSDFSNPSAIEGVSHDLDPTAVPRWQQFATDVVEAVLTVR